MSSFSLAPVAYWAAFLPIVAVHSSYFISASLGQVECCIPYIDSCTSISNAGRKYPAQVVFKTLLSASAMLMLAYWLFLVQWLRKLDPLKAQWGIQWMGTYAAIALILYCVTLGNEAPQQKELRRIGITLFFALTAFAHLLLVYRLKLLATHLKANIAKPIHLQTVLSYLLVVMGLMSGLLSAFAYEYYKTIDDAIEWTFALPMSLQFAVTGWIWRAEGFSVRFTLRG